MSQSEKMNNDRSGQRNEPMYFALVKELLGSCQPVSDVRI